MRRRTKRKQSAKLWKWYLTDRKMAKINSSTIFALEWYAKHDRMRDYGYNGSWLDNLVYACDRMNGGRAKAILRLIREQL